ncbi:hypothetical protein [Winogradskyella ursingii]|uniref:hypothetical protein n=1 Tax=Winogradskyella ursingii TaxID=2686079 RepID=UPI0015C743E4|nr:hypothetical protein [Winogradskyella ursingii]
MRKIHLFIALLITLSFASCKDNTEKAITEETTEVETTEVNQELDNAPTLPMDVITVYHTVRDYDSWRRGFDADSVARNASGLSFVAVERSVEKPNDVKIVLAPSDMDDAKSFIDNPRLKTVMDSLGVLSKPEIHFWNIIRYNTEHKKDGGTRLEITHKVNDFDTWVKGYDREGKETRAANGLNDLALGRGVDDPNMVHVVFAVTDIDKAKARINDPELKKLMEEAGVIGAPTITFYNDAN